MVILDACSNLIACACTEKCAFTTKSEKMFLKFCIATHG